MNVYESIVIFNSTLSDEEFQTARDKVSELITSSEGQVLKVEDWGIRKLAYEINKHKKGHFILFNYKAPSALNKKMEDYYKVFDPVVKYMIIKLGKKQIAALEASMRKSEEAAAAKAAAESAVETEAAENV